jgi:hypothetical protein
VKKLFCIMLLLTAGSIDAYDPSKKVMLISFTRAGLFGVFFGVLNNLMWCEKNDVIPVVCWDKASYYYVKEGYNGSTEPWEYYFEPVSDISVEEAKKRSDAFFNYRFEDPDRGHIPRTGCHNAYYRRHLNKKYRKVLNQVIQKYIRVKPTILEQVDRFYEQNMAGKITIGIHLRGTDKVQEAAQVTPEMICAKAHEIAQGIPGCQFFVATDETRLLEEMKKLLKGPVLSFDCHRSSNGKPLHIGGNKDTKAQVGEEVLIEALLLSRCNKLVHTRSNVSSAVLFMNADLENFVVYDEKACPMT